MIVILEADQIASNLRFGYQSLGGEEVADRLLHFSLVIDQDVELERIDEIMAQHELPQPFSQVPVLEKDHDFGFREPVPFLGDLSQPRPLFPLPHERVDERSP
jgi:hypothetical protein